MMLLGQLLLIWKPHFSAFRHGVTFKEVSGESKKVTKEMTAFWCNITNKTFIKSVDSFF